MSQLRIIERLPQASNGAFLAELDGVKVIFKPNHLEKELWDFPTGTLALRERATYVMDQLLGWNLVPTTELVETEQGFASVQHWVEATPTLVEIFPSSDVPTKWLGVLDGQGPSGEPLTLAHQDLEVLMKIALLDAVVNNADRKGGHILTADNGSTYAIDHGVTFHEEPKLRTVLWGWAGQQIPTHLQTDSHRTMQSIRESELTNLLTEHELSATLDRITELTTSAVFAEPNDEWPSLPWPLF